MASRIKKSKISPGSDLFGVVPVSIDEVRAWLIAVPKIDPDGPRAADYVRTWHVVEKIQAAKIAGTFDAAVKEKGPHDGGPSRLAKAFSASCA